MKRLTNGPVGSLWRTVTFPLRTSSPLLLTTRRFVTGDVWSESVTVRAGAGPRLRFSEIDEVQRPREGFGALNHRTYRVHIVDSLKEPCELVEAFRRDPNRFSPTSFATFVPDPAPEGLGEGATVEVKLPGPWDGPVHVRLVQPERIRFETLDGHMEAGWIEFRSSKLDGDVTVFEIESFARSGDEVFDFLYQRLGIGKRVQTEMWAQVLESAVTASGGRQQGRLFIDTVVYQGASRT